MYFKTRAPNVFEEVATEETIKGLRIGTFVGHLAREKALYIKILYNKFENYCRIDNDLHKRMEEQKRFN